MTNMKLKIDDKGREYIEYNSIVGLVRDYSPWVIEDFKKNNI